MPFLTQLADWCREVTDDVEEHPGWQTRGRSGGVDYVDGRPWAIMYHHTGSSDQDLADYHATQSDNAPVCNLDIRSDGGVIVIAAGPTNTNGKGQALRTSKGTVPADSMNSYAFGLEFYNSGTGQPWSQIQIDVGFAVITNIQYHLGLAPTDLFTHEQYAPDRKVDPAIAAAVQGEWKPRSKNSSGTWNDDDLRAENTRRASGGVGPIPIGDDVHPVLVTRGTNRYDLFATGEDDQLWQKWWDPRHMGADEWSEWEPRGGKLVGPPTAAVSGERIDIMAVGTDNHIWQLTWDGANWAPWLDLGASAMIAIAEGHVDLSDWLLLIAAIVFFVAALLPFIRVGRNADGTRARVAVSVEQIAAVGLCLLAIAFLIL